MIDPKRLMITEHIEKRGIKNPRVLAAMEKIPRELFVPDNLKSFAYGDFPLPIGEGQTISQPFIVAYMTDLLNLEGNEKVLEVGTGSGYQTAILAELASSVYTIERIESLSYKAQKILKNLGYNNIFFKIGDGTEGWEEMSPFDRIIVTAASSHPPPPLINQLNNNGIMIIPLGNSISQVLTMIQKSDGKLKTKEIDTCVFVPLVGKYGLTKY